MKLSRVQGWLLSLVIILLLVLPLGLWADPLDNWHERPAPSGYGLQSMAYGNNTFVGAGEFGTIFTSPDGVVWTGRSASYFGYDFHGIAYGKDTFVAVGDLGSIYTSPDGATWTQRRASFGYDRLYGVTYGNNIFVAVGMGYDILISSDGITWTASTSETSTYLSGVAYGNNTFVAVGNPILTSSDGVRWTEKISSGTYPHLHDVTYGNNIFVAVGEGGAIYTSPDGVSWTQRLSGTGETLLGVASGNNTFVAVGGTGTILSSPNGEHWTRRIIPTDDHQRDVAFGQDTFVTADLWQSDPFMMLSSGWNFVSLPRQPSITSTGTVLAEVSSKVRIVWGYDNEQKVWKKWMPDETANTLVAMEAGKGYWIYMNEAGTINISGWGSPPANVPLFEGWNLIGYMGAENRAFDAALGGITGKWWAVWNWDWGTWKVKTVDRNVVMPFPELSSVEKGKAYWIKVLNGQSGPWNQDATPPTMPAGLTATPVGGHQINLSWTASADNVAVAGYRVYRQGSYLNSVTQTTASDTGLSVNTEYCYAVSAFDGAGNESDRSVEACTFTQQLNDVPSISNLRFQPTGAQAYSGNVMVTGFADFTDQGGNVTTLWVSTPLGLTSAPVQGAAGVISGTLSGAVIVGTTGPPGTYFFNVWVTDSNGNNSNSLTGQFTLW
jgi:hypothetical protein